MIARGSATLAACTRRSRVQRETPSIRDTEATDARAQPNSANALTSSLAVSPHRLPMDLGMSGRTAKPDSSAKQAIATATGSSPAIATSQVTPSPDSARCNSAARFAVASLNTKTSVASCDEVRVMAILPTSLGGMESAGMSTARRAGVGVVTARCHTDTSASGETTRTPPAASVIIAMGGTTGRDPLLRERIIAHIVGALVYLHK